MLNRLISPDETSWPSLAEVRQASGIIDVALKAGVSANPKLLDPIEGKLKRMVSSKAIDPQLHNAAIGAAVRVAGYRNFSSLALVGGAPITVWLNRPLILSPEFNAIGNFKVDCGSVPGGAVFLYDRDEEHAKKTVLFDLEITRCSQGLDDFQWINVIFRNAKVAYEGGPLNLANVTFENCEFIGRGLANRKVLEQISAKKGKPVNLLVPAT